MLAFISLALFLSTAYSQTRTIWEYQLGTFLPNPAPGTPLGDHGALTEGFNLAVIPPEDSDWIDCYPGDQYCKSPAQINTVAPQPSRLPQGSCWTTFVYEYFQTFVTVPDDVTISQFSVVYPGGVIDDATRISIFNSQYPNGYTLAYTWFGESNTIDLAAYLVVGVNRLVITQLDVCCCANTVFAILTLTGQPLNPTCVPPAQDPCTTSTWDPTVGDCVLGHVEEGATCEDGDLCTVDDKCIDGACVSGDPVVCEASDQCHLPGTCDSTTGICSNPPKCDGKRCDDGNACTQLDVCKGGICVGKKPIICTVESDCQEPGECQPETGLCPRPENKCDGTTCNDGSACTVSDTCLDGECTGTPSEDGTSCDDGNACTENDTCQSGVCVGQAITCTASDECHDAGVCDPSSGECSDPVQKEDGSSCNDHDACTKTDVCTNGKCAGVQVCCRTGHGRCGTCVDDCRGSHRSVLSLFKLWNRGGRASGADDVDRGSSGCSGGKVCCVPRDQSTCRNNNNSCSIPDEDD